ncbi:staygreen family protein [Gracilibacillus kekensis]|uniref:Staygreen protein n=1 Tax=Gracilibacillus kekensis TaxID=1027249 RepID=A0A1M7LJY9_9BACI|nr:staygreen family protein [Gracilibacillus kekensis]SHM77888.1 Staygreen protein [Gracilibacillus kekensis]
MSDFNPEKLFVIYTGGVTATTPVIPRKYTLTHSDITGELFLTIGIQYAWENINEMRDEVLGEWRHRSGNTLYYCVYLYIDQGEYDINAATKRNEIFIRELPLALTAIRYGDRALFNKHPHLNQSSLIINFMSAYPQLARQENWGTFDRFIYR